MAMTFEELQALKDTYEAAKTARADEIRARIGVLQAELATLLGQKPPRRGRPRGSRNKVKADDRPQE